MKCDSSSSTKEIHSCYKSCDSASDDKPLSPRAFRLNGALTGPLADTPRGKRNPRLRDSFVVASHTNFRRCCISLCNTFGTRLRTWNWCFQPGNSHRQRWLQSWTLARIHLYIPLQCLLYNTSERPVVRFWPSDKPSVRASRAALRLW